MNVLLEVWGRNCPLVCDGWSGPQMLLSTDSIWRVKTHGGSDTMWTEAPSQFQLFWGPHLQHNYLHPNITVFQPVVHHHDRIWALDTFIQLLMHKVILVIFSPETLERHVCVFVRQGILYFPAKNWRTARLAFHLNTFNWGNVHVWIMSRAFAISPSS